MTSSELHWMGKWRDTCFCFDQTVPTRYGREISTWYKCFKNKWLKLITKVTQINAVRNNFQ